MKVQIVPTYSLHWHANVIIIGICAENIESILFVTNFVNELVISSRSLFGNGTFVGDKPREGRTERRFVAGAN